MKEPKWGEVASVALCGILFMGWMDTDYQVLRPR
jgi:hypothetical protein